MKTTKRLWPFVLADNKLAEEYLENRRQKDSFWKRWELTAFWQPIASCSARL